MSEINATEIARLVVDMLKAEGLVLATSAAKPATMELVDASTVAQALGVRREWVYEHAGQLGGQRIGTGKRPRWRFSLERALSLGADLRDRHAPPAAPVHIDRPRRRRAATADAAADLLPIRPATGRDRRAA